MYKECWPLSSVVPLKSDTVFLQTSQLYAHATCSLYIGFQSLFNPGQTTVQNTDATQEMGHCLEHWANVMHMAYLGISKALIQPPVEPLQLG